MMMNSVLENFSGFRGLNSTQIENFVAACVDAQHAPEEVLIHQGGREERVYFLYEGKVSIVVSTEKGERELATITAPAVLGEMEFLTGNPRSATVRVQEASRTLEIPTEALRTRINDGDPGALKIFYNIATVLAQRLAAMDTMLAKIQVDEPERTADLSAFQRKLYEDWSV